MRVQYIELAGKKYPMVMSLASIQRIEEEFGSLQGMEEALTRDGASSITALIETAETILGIFLDAGRIYAAANGEEVPPPLPCRVVDVLGVDSVSLIHNVIASSSGREVEAVSKNAGAAGEEAEAPRGSSSPEPRPD